MMQPNVIWYIQMLNDISKNDDKGPRPIFSANWVSLNIFGQTADHPANYQTQSDWGSLDHYTELLCWYFS